MKKKGFQFCLLTAAIAAWLMPLESRAQHSIHWQINPKGFPADVSIFADVEADGTFKRNLAADAFSVSMDEYAGEQGGWILNRQQVTAGQAGAEILVLVDISSSYTGAFSSAKQVLKSIIEHMDASRDRLAVATTPASGGFSEAELAIPFNSDKDVLTSEVGDLKTLPSSDKTGSRLCYALSEALRFFPEKTQDKYRAVILLTGGADKGEGKGDCVKDSYADGLVPFFPIVFKLDRKYDDARNSHKIENFCHDIAQNTGGRSIFRQSNGSMKQFVGLIWNRIRSQYHLRVMFPCYKPMPSVEHLSLLKVEGRDAEAIKFNATSAPPPTPVVTAFYPSQANSKEVEDGKVTLTVDGTGFCGSPGTVRVTVNGVQAAVKTLNPFRVTAALNSGHETGLIKVVNRYSESGESTAEFQVVKPPKGSASAGTLTFLVLGILLFAVLAILVVALRARRAGPSATASATASAATPQKPRKSDTPSPKSAAAATMAMSAVEEAWVEFEDGTRVDLEDGENLVGRETVCKVQITANGASREHCRIDCDKAHGLIWVEDLGSTNGTYYGRGGGLEKDAARLEKKQPVSSGDAIFAAGQKIVIRFRGGASGEG